MAMHLVPLLPTLIQKGQLEKCPNVGAFAGQRDEERHVGRIVLHALPIRVEINRPIVPSDRKHVGGHVLPNPDPLRERVPRNLELVRPPHRLRHRHRRRGAGRRRGVRRCGIRRRLRGFLENLTHTIVTVSAVAESAM